MRRLVLVLVSVAACGGDDDPQNPGTDAAAPADANVADGAAVDAAASDAASPVDAPSAEIDAPGLPIDAPPIANGWMDLGHPDDADGSSERVMGSQNMTVDATGGITVVWRQGGFASGSSTSRVWGNHYTPGAGWGTATMLQEDDFDGYGGLTIVPDGVGGALAVFTQRHGFPSEDTPPDLWANRHVPGVGWTGAVRLEAEASGAAAPHAFLDENGRATVVWHQVVGGVPQMWLRRFEPATGWTPAVSVPGSGADAHGLAGVASDGDGNLVAVWVVRDNDGVQNLWANRRAGGGWGTPVLLENLATTALFPDLAVGESGHAAVTWHQADADGSPFSAWAATFAPGAGWSAAVELDQTSASSAVVDVAIDPQGRAIAVWNTATSTSSLPWASRHEPGSGWTAPVQLYAGTSGLNPAVVVDVDGDATTAWGAYDGNVGARRFVAGTWGPAEVVQQASATASAPSLAVGPDGRVALAAMDDGWHLGVATHPDL